MTQQVRLSTWAVRGEPFPSRASFQIFIVLARRAHHPRKSGLNWEVCASDKHFTTYIGRREAHVHVSANAKKKTASDTVHTRRERHHGVPASRRSRFGARCAMIPCMFGACAPARRPYHACRIHVPM